MKVLGLQLERSSEHAGYVVLFDNAHGIDICVLNLSGLYRGKAQIAGIVIDTTLRRTAEDAAAALDDGLRALWASMAAIMKERARA